MKGDCLEVQFMRILQQDSRSLIPRVESMHLISRIVFLVGIVAYLIFDARVRPNFGPLLVIAAGQLATIGICLRIGTRDRSNISYVYLTTILIDLVLITGAIWYTGKSGSDYYLFYLPAVSVAAYILSSSAAISFAALTSVFYLLSIHDSLGYTPILGIGVRIGIIWLYTVTVNYISRYFRQSETRLLSLFDTLNRRTSELEKIHAQMEMVYENSRILAGILDFDQIVNEILKIGERVLDYPALGIMLIGPGGNLIYRGRLVGGAKNTRLRAVSRENMELAYRVLNIGETVRVNDMSGRTDYEPQLKSARSVMLVPMETHGKTTGLLTAESPRPRAFVDQDEQFLAVLARSAAMALENSILHRKTEELTIIDDLTGAYNYRYFAAKMEEEKRRAARYKQPLALIMIDIDWFKKFNDNYGHEVGNQVLIGMSEVIKRCIRDVDILCRYGGEEFIIILPQTVEREAMRIAERIRMDVETAEFGGGGGIPPLKVTVSVGLTSFPENRRSEDELINAVDQALYRAKGSGKNTVCTV
jgi:diguanylate cyclase (GGDEF)-like protein